MHLGSLRISSGSPCALALVLMAALARWGLQSASGSRSYGI
jgi:hypothetical protein